MTREVLYRYAAEPGLPELVARAVGACRDAGFDQACRPEVGRLLCVLATVPDHGRIAELGTAGGVGAAWIATGMRPGCLLVTYELDEKRAALARQTLAGAPGVEVVHGDTALAAGRGPFDLVFADSVPKHEPDAPDRVAAMLRLGGLVLMDDFTPGRIAADDPTRAIWLGSPRFRCIELGAAPDLAVLLGVRIS